MNNPDQDVFVIRGGQGASKTISILQLIIQALVSSDKEVSVLSSELSKMKRTVIRDYKKICKDWGVIKNEDDFNKSESKHEYSNGSYIDFLGADTSDVGKGFRRDILYINEADKMDIETAVQFISRAKLTIIDYNPDSLFWGDEYINDKNFITLTFKDNEFLHESERKSILDYKTKGFKAPDLPFDELFKDDNIKSRYWSNKWKVYGLGLVGSIDGVVFENWSVINSIPTEAKLISYGLDWGYSSDPTALEAIYRAGNKIYIDELIYQTGLTNSDIALKMRQLGVNQYIDIIADCAEPKSIEDIYRAGFKQIKPSIKGADSIRNSINTLQEFEIFITARSKNIISEFEKYTWDKDKNGNKTGEPIGTNDHAIAGIRYVALNKLRKTSTFIAM